MSDHPTKQTTERDPLEDAARAYIEASEGRHPDPDSALSKLVHEAGKVARITGSRDDSADPWRETVRDIYDMMHFKHAHSAAARDVVALIEDRHTDSFCPERSK